MHLSTQKCDAKVLFFAFITPDHDSVASALENGTMTCANRIVTVCLIAVTSWVLQAGCASERTEAGVATPTKLPLMVDVPQGTVVDGFASGRLRKTTELDAYRITKHPITLQQYGECVDAGACSAVEHPACRPEPENAYPGFRLGLSESPALCVGRENAERFCKWVGGSLPTLLQWLYAARGPEPKRYAWGDAEARCEHHPRIQTLAAPSGDAEGEVVAVEACAARGSVGKAALRVGEHAKGASPFGVEDVLLASAELLAVDSSALVSACVPGFPACLVTSSTPGSIDSASALESDTASVTYAFRCVSEEN